MGGSSHISNHACCRGHFIRSLPTFLRNGNAISIATTAGLSTIAFGHDRRCRQAINRWAALDHMPRAVLYGRRATVAAAIGPQEFLLCRQERLLGYTCQQTRGCCGPM